MVRSRCTESLFAAPERLAFTPTSNDDCCNTGAAAGIDMVQFFGRSFRYRNEFIKIDKQIHLNLAQIAGNPIYTSILHSIHDNIHRYYDRFLSMEKKELEENYQDLCNIVRAAEAGNVGEARKFAQEHVLRFNRYMKQREQNEENLGI